MPSPLAPASLSPAAAWLEMNVSALGGYLPAEAPVDLWVAPLDVVALGASAAWGANDITPWVPEEMAIEMPAAIAGDAPLVDALAAQVLGAGSKWDDVPFPGGA